MRFNFLRKFTNERESANEPLFSWQENLEQYALQISSVYELMKEGINQHCSGLDGKIILEIGAAHQLPQAFGVDITHPEMTSTNGK